MNTLSLMRPVACVPDLSLKHGFLRALDDYEAFDPITGTQYSCARSDFEGYLERLRREEYEETKHLDYAPCSHRWLFDGETVVGFVRIRHRIDCPMLAEELGHIGYDVPPSYRGRGYGIASLQAGLEHAHKLGIRRVLIYANSNNPRSWRTIEHCGGILEIERYSDIYRLMVKKYWIDLDSGL